jgi:hypothetical protein
MQSIPLIESEQWAMLRMIVDTAATNLSGKRQSHRSGEAFRQVSGTRSRT